MTENPGSESSGRPPGSSPAPRPSSADLSGSGRPGTPASTGPASKGAVSGGTYGPKRTSSQIRTDIENERAQLGQSVDHLRDRVAELTDWRGQLQKHRKKIVVGAVAAGFVAGGLMALRRR